MSEQEKECEKSPVVLLEQPVASKQKQSFGPKQVKEDESELHHKRSRAPAVPCMIDVADEARDNAQSDTKNKPERDRDITSENTSFHHSVAKKLSSKANRRASSPESITLATIDVSKKSTVMPAPQPIMPKVASVKEAPVLSPAATIKQPLEKTEDEDSITDEVSELRTPELAKKTSMWSDEEEAGGLPRSESRASRVSRAVRQLLCCGDHKSHNKRRDRRDPFLELESERLHKLGERKHALMESKSSFGPCYRSSTPHGTPSGIALYMPRRNRKSACERSGQNQSVINISISKKCLDIKKKVGNSETIQNLNPREKFLGTLKNKLSSVTVFLKDMIQN